MLYSMIKCCCLLKIRNLYSILFFLLILSACGESSKSVFRLSEKELLREYDDSLHILVDAPGVELYLSGEIKLKDGVCQMELYSPHVDTVYVKDSINPEGIEIVTDTLYERDLVYSQNVRAPVDLILDETFRGMEGIWKCYLQVLEEDNIDPSGSFELVFEYR